MVGDGADGHQPCWFEAYRKPAACCPVMICI